VLIAVLLLIVAPSPAPGACWPFMAIAATAGDPAVVGKRRQGETAELVPVRDAPERDSLAQKRRRKDRRDRRAAPRRHHLAIEPVRSLRDAARTPHVSLVRDSLAAARTNGASSPVRRSAGKLVAGVRRLPTKVCSAQSGSTCSQVFGDSMIAFPWTPVFAQSILHTGAGF